MERLDITSAPEHPNIEASIHVARYAIAKELVAGKTVLDIACGQGYGSYLLKQAGAERVVGVDVSPETVERARANFSAPGLDFLAADAAEIGRLFPDGFFDVVVSLETIEHLTDPAAFLTSLKRAAKPNGAMVISCPNDHWYYPEDTLRNPFHVRKYRFEEFQQLAMGVLGNEVRWSLGSAFFGFGSTPLSIDDAYHQVPGSWMSYREIDGAFVVSGEPKLKLRPTNCSYFVGVWNAPKIVTGAAVFPLGMDDYVAMVRAQANEQTGFLEQSESPDPSVQRVLSLRLQASEAENSLLRERLHLATAENALLRGGHDRYVRMRNLIPRPLRSLLVKAARTFRGSAK